MRIEVILLDFRNQSMCRRYAEYRKYDTEYVQHEILATILMLIEASTLTPLGDRTLPQFPVVYLPGSNGSSDEVIITREDAVDYAARDPPIEPKLCRFMK